MLVKGATGRISTNCNISISKNARKCKYVFMLPKINSAQLGLTHCDRVMHICVGKLNIIGLDNGLSPGRRQTIIWINDGILLIGPLGTNLSEILVRFKHFHYKKCTRKCCLRNGVHFVSASMCYNRLLPYSQGVGLWLCTASYPVMRGL